MSWPASFRGRLFASGTVRLAVIFEVILPTSGEGVGAPWWAASDPRLAADGVLLLGSAGGGIGAGPRIGPCAVAPQSWEYQEGAWSVSLHIRDGQAQTRAGPGGRAIILPSGGAWGKVAAAVRRGALCRLLVGEVGWSREQYQPLRIGRVQGVSCSHPDLISVEVWDLVTALRSRLSALSTSSGAEDRQLLFYDSATSTTLSGAYTVGDTTLNVTATTPFNRATGGTGAVRLTNTTLGRTFYLTYAGTGSGTLTGVSSSGQYGTTAVAVGSAGAVQAIPLLAGHPVTITRRLLTSTGAGGNGAHDLYPAPWAFGLDEDWLDSADLSIMQLSLLVLSSGSYTWTGLPDSAQVDALGWWSQYLSAAGLWICTRQGQIVMRAARDPNTASVLIAEALTDADLLRDSAPSVEWYPPDVPVSYTRHTVTGTGSPATSLQSVSCLPAGSTLAPDLYDVLQGVSAEQAIREEVSGRCAPWAHRVPEVVSLEVTGIRGYCPGDVLPLTLSGLRGRLSGTRQGYRERPVMVLEELPDLGRATTRLRLAVLPTGGQEDGL
jgi:hypothetical protein